MPQTRNQQIINRLTKSIVLIGMMGSGKTTLGRALATALELDFKDTDKIIEEKAGRPTAEIFTEYGEEKFRKAEMNTIADLLDSRKIQVIATGGGAILNEQTRQRIKTHSLSIWLNADIDTLYNRVSKNQTRPLLQTDDPKQTLQDLMEARIQFYEQAHLHFKLDHGSMNAALGDLLEQLAGFLAE